MTSDDPVTGSAPSAVRCSDAERERTAAALHQAVGEGRLSLTEVEERTTAIYAARYRHELDAVVADLPAPEPAAASGWRPVLTGLGHQVSADLMSLTAARRRALLIALVVLAVVAGLMLAVHGITDDGHGPHAFGHD
jgi:uncharacterized protein DUF1707